MICKSKESKSLERPPPAIPQAALAHTVPVVLLRPLPWHFETACLVKPSKDRDLWGLEIRTPLTVHLNPTIGILVISYMDLAVCIRTSTRQPVDSPPS